jgi:hypothetical protein
VVIDHGGDHTFLPFRILPFHIDFNQGIFAHDTYFALEKKGIFFNYESVYDYELNNYIKNINCRRIIFVLQPCFSGGFINDLSGKNRVIITSSKENQLAEAPFISYFYQGLNGSINDTNNDGKISLAEIYEYTAGMVYDWITAYPTLNGGPQYPMIDDNGDKVGHRYQGIFGYNTNDPNKDGYIATHIFDLAYESLS